MTRAMVLDELKSEWFEDAVATIIGLAHNQDIVTADDLAREIRKPPVGNWVGLAFNRAGGLTTKPGAADPYPNGAAKKGQGNEQGSYAG